MGLIGKVLVLDFGHLKPVQSFLKERWRASGESWGIFFLAEWYEWILPTPLLTKSFGNYRRITLCLVLQELFNVDFMYLERIEKVMNLLFLLTAIFLRLNPDMKAREITLLSAIFSTYHGVYVKPWHRSFLPCKTQVVLYTFVERDFEYVLIRHFRIFLVVRNYGSLTLYRDSVLI